MLSISGSIVLLRIWHGKQEQHRGIESIIEVNNCSNFSLCRVASLAGRDFLHLAGRRRTWQTLLVSSASRADFNASRRRDEGSEIIGGVG